MDDIRVNVEVIDINERITCLFREEESMIMILSKDEEPIGKSDAIWE
jgi:hypothetical protein